MKYGVTIPIAGHSYIEVDADNEKEAVDKAFESCESGELSWEPLECFVQGNVTHCPSPNEIEVSEVVDE